MTSETIKTQAFGSSMKSFRYGNDDGKDGCGNGRIWVSEKDAITSGHRIIGNNFIFMHDNDPKHTTKICQNYLRQL